MKKFICITLINFLSKTGTLILNSCVFFLLTTSVHAQTWSAAGTGLDNSVYSLAADTLNNVLYASGHFDFSGTTAVNRVAKWDGVSWSPLGTGMTEDVYCLVMYNGELYAGGRFITADGNPCNHVARWDGVTWQPLGLGTDADVYYLHVFNGDLYACGIFSTAGGVTVNGIARWDGTAWSTLGTGIAGGGFPQAYTMQSYKGNLYLGGQFTDVGGVPVSNIARWDGSSWSDPGGGVAGVGAAGSTFVGDLIIYHDTLIVTGSFVTVIGDTSNGIAKFDGTYWKSIGFGLKGR